MYDTIGGKMGLDIVTPKVWLGQKSIMFDFSCMSASHIGRERPSWPEARLKLVREVSQRS
jgi:hypothetical protein